MSDLPTEPDRREVRRASSEYREIEERHRQALERIKKLEELQQIEDKADHLRRSFDVRPSRQSRRRRRSSGSSSSSDDNRRMKITIKNIDNLPLHSTRRKRDEWLRDLQRAFAGDPKKFKTQRARILFAQDYMDNECRSRWQRYLEQEPELSNTRSADWDHFQKWTVHLLDGAIHREPNTMITLVNTRQLDTQDPIEFDYYLDSLEKEFQPLPEKEKAFQFFAKLTDTLRNEILKSVPTLPDTRQDMVHLASRHWVITRKNKPFVPKIIPFEKKKPRYENDDESPSKDKPKPGSIFQRD